MKMSLVSVVIPSRERKKILIQTIDTLKNQTFKDFEVIVVDQSEEPIERHELPEKLDITILPDKHYGQPQAKNIGLRKAKGQFIIFLDDDVICPPELIEAHVKNYADKEIAGVAGRVLEENMPKGKGPVGKISRYDLSMTHNFNSTTRCFVDHAVGCNWSARKKVLEESHGFDENLYPGRGTAFFEETELCFRLKKAGHRLVFDPEATVEHLRAKQGGARVKSDAEFSYWLYRNKTYFFLKDLKKVFLPFYLARQFASIAKKVIQTPGLKTKTDLAVWSLKGLGAGTRAFFEPKAKVT